MAELGAVVIGLGMMGQGHARVWSELPGTRLVAVYDLVPEKTRQMAERYGCLAAATAEEAVTASGVDLVSVCTDEGSHLAPCTWAAAAGKHVLVEKPLATEAGECDQIIAAAAEGGVRLMVGHIVRFDPRYQVAKSLLDEGEVGEVVQIYGRRNNWVSSGRRIGPRASVLHFLGVHDLDIMRWYLGCEATRVYAESCRKVLTAEGADDTVFALLKYENQAVGCLETCWVVPKGQPNALDARLEVVGTQGRIAVSEGDSEPLVLTKPDGSRRPDFTYGPVWAGQQGGALRTQLEHFARCLLNDQPFIITPEDAKAAVVLANAIQESLDTQAPVYPAR